MTSRGRVVTEDRSDEWVPTVCFMCYNNCGILVKVSDGKAVSISGNPDCPHNQGRVCAKGLSALANLYEPHRLLKPLKRTNPEKGIGVDPQWVEIEWEEALATIGARLRKVRQADPRRLVFLTFDTHAAHLYKAWVSAFGSPNYEVGTPNFFCGNNVHPFAYLAHGAFFMEPDLDHCKYLMLFGCQFGHGILSNAMDSARRLAEARQRGLKLVVVDPVCSRAAAKADEWVPLRPGTDGALALGLLNVLVNELGVYDVDFLKRYTNAPYLVRRDGTYLRDPETGKPLVWDSATQAAAPFDEVDPEDVALDGEYRAHDTDNNPAFQLLKNHLRKYDVQSVSAITTVPTETIAHIASEFATVARFRGTVNVDGRELPLRPTCVLWNRGPSQHKHAMLTGFALYLMNVLMGAVDVPGGILGSNPVGPGWGPTEDGDGILMPSSELSRKPIVLPTIYPPGRIKPPERISLRELFPVAPYSGIFMIEALLEPEKYRLPYFPEILIVTRTNPLMTGADPTKMARALAKIPFIVSISGRVDETAELADYVLPDPALLEILLPFANRLEKPLGGNAWFSMLAQPVVSPRTPHSHPFAILYRLAEEAGFLDRLNSTLNSDLELKDVYRLSGAHRYTWDEVCDRWLKSRISPAHGLEWMKTRGVHVLRKKKVEETYQRMYVRGRSPIYLEHMQQTGEELSRLLEKMGLPWDLTDYQPLPDWKPCPSYRDNSEGSLFLVNFKLPEQALSTGYTVANPWLGPITNRNRGFDALINTETAKRLGILDGEEITLESEFGYEAKTIARITERVHPEVIGVPGAFGHWARSMGEKGRKGLHWNSFIPIRLDRIDMVSAAVDTCVRVSIRK